MTCRVRLFARAKDLAGAESVTVALPAGATVADLRRQLASEYPSLAVILQRSAIAVAGDFAEDSLTLPATGEVALLPPVSGGS
jgi:molybdopterin converting factor subunit 1